AEHGRRRVVEVDGRHLRADEGFDGAFDEVLSRLGEHGDAHIVGNRVLVDDLADEVEVDLAGGGETDLDLLEPETHEQIEHLPLSVGGHRIDQGLVAVSQIGAQPPRSLADGLIGPGAVAHVQGDALLEGLVLAERHRGGLLQFHCSSISSSYRSEEHTSELQSRFDLVCRLLLEKKNKKQSTYVTDTCKQYN